jgi:hypothetical protein
MFGGSVTPTYFLNDLWVAPPDLSGWQLLIAEGSTTPNLPSRRANAAMCVTWDDHGFFVIGGYDGTKLFADTYLYDMLSASWTVIPITIPYMDDPLCVVSQTTLYIQGMASNQNVLFAVNTNTSAVSGVNLPPEVLFQKVTIKGSAKGLYLMSHESGTSYFSDYTSNKFVQLPGQCPIKTVTKTFVINDVPACLSIVHDTLSFAHNTTASLVSVKTGWPLWEWHDIGNGAYMPIRQSILLFGGQLWSGDQAYVQTMLIASYDVVNNKFSVVVPPDNKPVARSAHRTAIVGDRMVLFGGTAPEALSDTWVYDLNTKVWTEVYVDGAPSTPPRRSQHVMYARGDSVLVHGGLSASKSYLSDMWSFSMYYQQWSQMIYSANDPASVPRERGGHMAWEWNGYFMIFGGTNTDAVAINDMWVFDFQWQRWREVQGTHSPLRHAGVVTAPNGGIIVMSGEKVSGITTTSISMITFTDDGTTITAKWTRVGTIALARANHRLISLTNDRKTALVYGGSSRTLGIYKSAYLATIDTTSPIPSVTTVLSSAYTSSLPPRSGHSFSLDPIRGQALVFGGYSDHYTLNNDVTSISIEKPSVLCPAGTTGVTTCSPCPPGFFNPYTGATSTLDCLPCPMNSYSSASGSSSCSACTGSCPIGATNVAQNYAIPFVYAKVSPPGLVSHADIVVYQTNIVYIVAGCIWFIFLVIIGIWLRFGDAEKTDDMFKQFDFAYSENHHICNGNMIKRSTMCGGIGTIFLLLVLIPLYAISVIPYWYDNIEETSAQASGEPVDYKVTSPPVYVTVQFIGLTETACVMDYVKVIPTDITVAGKVEVTVAMSLGICTVAWRCTSCALSPTASIDVRANHFTAFARAVYVTVEAAAGDPNAKNVKLSVPVIPPTNNDTYQPAVFRGLSQPSTVNFAVVNVIFSDTVSAINTAGYDLHLITEVPGSTVFHNSFSSTEQLRVLVHLNLATTSYQLTVGKAKVTLVTLISSLLGLTVGLMGAVGVVVKVLETFRFLYYSHKSAYEQSGSLGSSVVYALKEMSKPIEDDPYDRRKKIGPSKLTMADLQGEMHFLEEMMMSVIHEAFPKKSDRDVNRDEFRYLAISVFGDAPQLMNNLEAIFKAIDKDGSGTLDSMELAEWLLQMIFDLSSEDNPSSVAFSPASTKFLQFQFFLNLFLGSKGYATAKLRSPRSPEYALHDPVPGEMYPAREDVRYLASSVDDNYSAKSVLKPVPTPRAVFAPVKSKAMIPESVNIPFGGEQPTDDEVEVQPVEAEAFSESDDLFETQSSTPSD